MSHAANDFSTVTSTVFPCATWNSEAVEGLHSGCTH